ncbi:DUF975 domain-containing protein [Aphanothece sacrum]|uniref:RDD domain-containing protein n=1 Tax=Aphanothece sacrum FPU1 TaxID=1920663 RepID=A0A401IEP7_APHSA|nr:DUF975 domain-containing protein [Aphanothece sacrum]GBF79745.1 RDD domain-containing protein [Aphanothece sacrum FPU1]GBF85723.1 hypothetical protein AsFPU3_2788 [Aphanothece sacrum FPU3]
MSKSSNTTQSLGTLSIGNVVSAGLRIYRDHFKLYYTQALISYFWLFVPVYGWAKFSAIQGLIARLAFHEVIERPETIHEARQQVQPRMWNFLVAGFLVFLIVFASVIIGAIIFGLFALILGLIFASAFQDNQIILGIVGFIFGIIAFFIFMFGYIWIFSRLSIVELPIAIESQSDASFAINRSWKLTKGSVLRLQLIFFVAFLVTLPLSLIINFASLLIPSDSPIYLIFNLVISILVGALVIPFWQTIKAVVYYDLRSRKEGLGLEIKDSLSDD